MYRFTFILAAAILLLTACSSQPIATSAPAATVEPSPTFQEARPTQPPPTQAPPAETAATELPSAGAVVFQIVPGESQLKYEVYETFINDNNRLNLAVGITPQVSGEITVDRAAPANSVLGTITADISQFKSDSGRRDNALRDRFIQSARYPTVSFNVTSIEGLPESYQEGQEVTLIINGDLTIRDVTRPVSCEAKVKLEGEELSGEAVTTILMSDFGFGPISIGGILNTEDEVKATLTFVARP